MKILLFGMDGQVGWELQRSLAPLGELVAVGRASYGVCGDLSNQEGIRSTVQRVNPTVIVNAAAYTAVDKAENEPVIARAINAAAPAILAEEATQRNALLVHYSTDYVFDGSGSKAWQETDTPAPLNAYGMTKLDGENAIRSTGCRHLIFRTSWVYAARGNNFAKTMLRLAKERDQLNIINDQVGAPTGAELIADVTAHAIRASLASPGFDGIYHLAAAGETTWHGYASFVIETARDMGIELKVPPDTIQPILTSSYPTAARRPLNSRLDTNKICSTFDLQLPAWQVGVARMLTEILDK